jgi:hypothetical protein
MKPLSLIVALALTGCATLERHPVLTAVGVAILAGSIAAIAEHQHDLRRPNAMPESCHATFQCVTR